MSRMGTSYFPTLTHAVLYYSNQGIARARVEDKIAEGDIHIGKPKIRKGEKLVLIDGCTRYAIEDGKR